MKTSPNDWLSWDEKEVLPFTGGIRFHLRTVEPITVTNEFGLLLAYGTGQQEIAVTGTGECHFQCDGAIWLRPSSRVQERLKASTEIFTTLDRPAPMSPEMQAIQRMMRRNEIERERDRQEMEKRFADRQFIDVGSQPSNDVGKAPPKETEKVRTDAATSSVGAEKQSEPSSGNNAPPNGEPAGASAGDDSEPPDS